MEDAVGNIAAQEAAWWADWRARDFSWDGLAAHRACDTTLQDYWANPRHSLIAEPGTSRRWTRFHCPLVFADGTTSPKATWSTGEWCDLERSLRTRLALSDAERPCWLDGCVLRRMEEGADDAGEAYLWISARWAHFREGVDLRNNSLGLSDFQGAWLGAGSDFSGARQLQPNFGSAVHIDKPEAVIPFASDRVAPAVTHSPMPPHAAIAPVRLTPETVAAPSAKNSDLGLKIAAAVAVIAAIGIALAAFLRF